MCTCAQTTIAIIGNMITSIKEKLKDESKGTIKVRHLRKRNIITVFKKFF